MNETARLVVTDGKRTYTDGERTYYACGYIESSGTQYIDTGKLVANGMRYDFKARWLTELESTGTVLFGANASTQEVMLGYENMTKNYLGGGFSYGWSTDTDYTISIDLQLANVNNVSLTVNDTVVRDITGGAYGTKSLYLFGGVGINHATVCVPVAERFYSFTVTESTGVTLDLHPCYYETEDKTRVYGMLDTVSSTFYGNAGTGAFTGGEPESATEYRVLVTTEGGSRLPTGLQEVEYIQNGATGSPPEGATSVFCCIDTGVSASTVKRLVGDIKVVGTYVQNTVIVMNTSSRLWLGLKQASTVMDGTFQGNWNVTNGVVDKEGRTFKSCDCSMTSGTVCIAGWIDTVWTDVYQYHELRLYDSSDRLLADLVPCYQTSDTTKAGCMYDLVSESLMQNSGTGAYSVGEDVSAGETNYRLVIA